MVIGKFQFIEQLHMTQRQLRLSFFISEFAHLLHSFQHIKLKQTIQKRLEERVMRYTMKLKLTHDEVRVLVFALNELRNTLIAENRYTDPVDEILARLIA